MKLDLIEYIKIYGASGVFILIAIFIAYRLLLNILTRDLEQTKKELQRELDFESRKDAYKSELAIRQLNAAEKMWSLFTVTSLSNIGNNIVHSRAKEHYYFIHKNATDFIEEFNKTFSTEAGLYISKETRMSLHAFRDYILEEMINKYNETSDRKLNSAQLNEYKKLRKNARLMLRNEVGSTNLTIASDEFNSTT